jgi:hypothetical protein
MTYLLALSSRFPSPSTNAIRWTLYVLLQIGAKSPAHTMTATSLAATRVTNLRYLRWAETFACFALHFGPGPRM